MTQFYDPRLQFLQDAVLSGDSLEKAASRIDVYHHDSDTPAGDKIYHHLHGAEKPISNAEYDSLVSQGKKSVPWLKRLVSPVNVTVHAPRPRGVLDSVADTVGKLGTIAGPPDSIVRSAISSASKAGENLVGGYKKKKLVREAANLALKAGVGVGAAAAGGVLLSRELQNRKEERSKQATWAQLGNQAVGSAVVTGLTAKEVNEYQKKHPSAQAS